MFSCEWKEGSSAATAACLDRYEWTEVNSAATAGSVLCEKMLFEALRVKRRKLSGHCRISSVWKDVVYSQWSHNPKIERSCVSSSGICHTDQNSAQYRCLLNQLSSLKNRLGTNPVNTKSHIGAFFDYRLLSSSKSPQRWFFWVLLLDRRLLISPKTSIFSILRFLRLHYSQTPRFDRIMAMWLWLFTVIRINQS